MTALRQREPREHDDTYLSMLRDLPCIRCGWDAGCEAAHIRMSTQGKFNAGVGQKPHDRYAIPLCSQCHRDQHSRGERLFWNECGIDPLPIAAALYRLRKDFSAMYGHVRWIRQTSLDLRELPF